SKQYACELGTEPLASGKVSDRCVATVILEQQLRQLVAEKVRVSRWVAFRDQLAHTLFGRQCDALTQVAAGQCVVDVAAGNPVEKRGFPRAIGTGESDAFGADDCQQPAAQNARGIGKAGIG